MAARSESLAAIYETTQASLADRVAQFVIARWAAEMAAPTGSIREAANRWLALAVPAVLRYREDSRIQGGAYYLAKRRIELPDAPPLALPRPPEVDRQALTSSLWFVGPRDYVDLGRPLDDSISEERVNAISGSAIRHTLNGGRDQIEAAYDSDPLALGYYRVEDSDPCYFCAMLMSRGTVFRGDSFDKSDVRFFGPGDAKVHDHCGGRLEPDFSGEPFPGDTKRFHEMWTGGEWDPARNSEGQLDVVLGWRRFYEGQRKS